MAPNSRDRSIVIMEKGIIAVIAFNALNGAIDSIVQTTVLFRLQVEPL